MKTIVIMCDPDRIDPELLSSLRQLFPDCEIQIVFTEKRAAAIVPIAVTLNKAHA